MARAGPCSPTLRIALSNPNAASQRSRFAEMSSHALDAFLHVAADGASPVADPTWVTPNVVLYSLRDKDAPPLSWGAQHLPSCYSFILRKHTSSPYTAFGYSLIIILDF